jgi:hypothetical protein
MDTHKQTCDKRFVVCNHCLQNVVFSKLESHESECKITCKLCKEEILRQQCEKHLNSSCAVSPDADFACLCGVTIKRKDQESHINENITKHIVLYMNEYDRRHREIEDTLSDTNSTLDQLKSDTFVLDMNLPTIGLRVRSQTCRFKNIDFSLYCTRADDKLCRVYLHSVKRNDAPLCTQKIRWKINESTFFEVKTFRSDGCMFTDNEWKLTGWGRDSFNLPVPIKDHVYQFKLRITLCPDSV